MERICGNPCCKKLKLKDCSACLTEGYCSPDCQKSDWKVHKLMCGCMKSSSRLLPFSEVREKLKELERQADLKKGTNIERRLLEFWISFGEHQFGIRIKGKSYRERGGYQVENYTADIIYLVPVCRNLGYCYFSLTSKMGISDIKKDALSKTIHFYEKALSIIEPYRAQLDLEPSKRIDRFDDKKSNNIFGQLSHIENGLSDCYTIFFNYEKARVYCDMAIAHAKRVIGEESTQLLYDALSQKGRILNLQLNLSEAKATYEETYNFMVEKFYPDHPLVLEVANRLIKVLIRTEEYFDAERFARISYECLTRPIDTESKEVGFAAEALATVTHRLLLQNGSSSSFGNIEDVEMLARKALKIKERIHGQNHYFTSSILYLISNILRLKKSRDDEVLDLLDRCLAMSIKHVGVDHENVANYSLVLAEFHGHIGDELPDGKAKIGHYRLAERHCKEAVRIETKLRGPNHPLTLTRKSVLKHITDNLSALHGK